MADRRTIKSLLIGAVLGLFALVMASAIVWGLQNEQDDIRDRVAAALADANLPIQEIDVQGRDVVLAGAPNELVRADAEGLVRELEGVRSVEWNDLPPVIIITDPESQVTEPPATTAEPGSTAPSTTAAGSSSTASPTSAAPAEVANISATLQQGVLRLSGAVPDAESAARLAAVADLIYAPFVEGEILVDESLESASWVPNAAGVISVLPVISTSGVQVVGEEAVVFGNAPSDVRKAQLEGALGQALGADVVVVSQVEVSALEPPFLAAAADGDGTVAIDGVVPSQEVADSIIGRATQVYGDGNVDNGLEVRDGIAETFSLFRVPLVFVQFAPVPQWEFTIEDDLITGSLKGGATFAYGSAELSDQLIVLLNTAAGILTRNPTLVGTVDGHTDDVGSDDFNQNLSEDRARAAVDYLIGAGVDPARVFAVGYGESQPIADNSTPEGRAINRRIEFFLGPAPQGGA